MTDAMGDKAAKPDTEKPEAEKKGALAEDPATSAAAKADGGQLSGDPAQAYNRVLVIRHGALGDFVQSLGPMKAIRDFHKRARITLLTTPMLESLARGSGYFDDVWLDTRPPAYNLLALFALRRRLRSGRFDRVYDLQTSSRTARYWRMMGGTGNSAPEWSGHVPGCSHPDPDPDRNEKHSIDRQRGQLAAAGILNVPLSDLGWVTADVVRFEIVPPYALLVPGGSAHRPEKRWPAEKYAALARRMVQRHCTPVLIGAAAERTVMDAITDQNPQIVNLCGETEIEDIAVLARSAVGAVGNDTGPMHLIAMAGAPSLVLFSGDSDPALCAPRPGLLGGEVNVIRRDNLQGLSGDEVEAALPFKMTGRG